MPQRKIRGKQRSLGRVVLTFALGIGMVALPATAAVFSVTLTTGSEIDTRYRPIESQRMMVDSYEQGALDANDRIVNVLFELP